MAEKDQEGLESALELLRERTTKDGAKALEKSLKLSSLEEKIAHWAGFIVTLISGIPGFSGLSTQILAQTSWDGMRRAIAELEDERLDDAKRAELLALFDESNAEQHVETVRAVGKMLSNHRDELEAKMLELFQAQFSKLAWQDKEYRVGLSEQSMEQLGELYFEMKRLHKQMFEQMEQLEEEFKARLGGDSHKAGRDLIKGDQAGGDIQKAGRDINVTIHNNYGAPEKKH